ASTSAALATDSLNRFCGPCSFASESSTQTQTTDHGPPFQRYCASGSGRTTSTPRNSVRKRRVAAISLHSMVPCDSSSALIIASERLMELLPGWRQPFASRPVAVFSVTACRLVLVALLAQRRVEQLRRAVLDLPPVAVAVDEIESVGAVAEARLLHAAEPEVLLPRVDLLEGGIDRRLARYEHAPVVEHLLRRLDRGHLAGFQHPIGP